MSALSSRARLIRRQPAGTYSAEQWEAIRKSLARIGVGLDVMVKPDWSALTQPLHQVLQNLSSAFAEVAAAPRSWRPLIEDMRQATAALEAAHAIFARYLDTDVEAIDAELMPVITKTRQRLDRLLEKGGRDANARKPHIEFWSRLARMWQQIKVEHPPTRRPLRMELIEFLRACSSASFPAAATKYALKNFVDRTVYSITHAPIEFFQSAPSKVLDLLAAVVGDPPPGSVYMLGGALSRLKEAAPDLVHTRKFQKLQTYATPHV
jgi:hypothetical protein